MCLPPDASFLLRRAVFYTLCEEMTQPRIESTSMNIEQTMLVAEAARQYEEDGVISTTTFVALTLAGLDAEAILQNIEETRNG
jgi:hypothetical protein